MRIARVRARATETLRARGLVRFHEAGSFCAENLCRSLATSLRKPARPLVFSLSFSRRTLRTRKMPTDFPTRDRGTEIGYSLSPAAPFYPLVPLSVVGPRLDKIFARNQDLARECFAAVISSAPSFAPLMQVSLQTSRRRGLLTECHCLRCGTFTRRARKIVALVGATMLPVIFGTGPALGTPATTCTCNFAGAGLYGGSLTFSALALDFRARLDASVASPPPPRSYKRNEEE